MNAASVLLGLSVCAVLLAGCSSRANKKTACPSDAGVGGHGGSASAVAKSCNPFAKPVCGPGRTCCFADPAGTCSNLSACTSPVQVQCASPAQCKPGELCCATFVPEPRSAGSAAGTEDASGPSPTADAGVMVTSFCAKSCAAPSVILCETSADCANGASCTTLPEGSNPGLIAVAVEIFLTCAGPGGGTPP